MRVIEFWDDIVDRSINNVEEANISEEKLDIYSHLIWNDVKLQDYKIGWFGKTERCTTGIEILKWVIARVDQNETKAVSICQQMVDMGIIERIDTQGPFEGTSNCIIWFYEDRDDIADNLLHPWKGDVGFALDHSAELVNLIM